MRRALEGLHEQTEYKFRGKETNSTSWTPKRGLREGCATSPKLFNVYHSTLMRLAKEKRRKKCEKDGTNLGIEEWQYIPGHSLTPKDRRKARGNTSTKKVTITESLFADDTTVVGRRNKMERGKEKIKETVEWFEEKCHPGKEEYLEFGRNEANEIRMLGTYMDRKHDVKQSEQNDEGLFCVEE